ncbi:MAG: YeeE/YedE thiosulfate transporter family protein [Vicingaceae bacterium]|nr:YeeE/YedE thiosulfate transporter family protein [Vicingaceae bacterium]
MDILSEPWPWYVTGPLIGLFVPLLLIIGNKAFGISSSIKHICAACLPVKSISFFNYDWKKDSWNLFLVAGIILGGIVTGLVVDLDYSVMISEQTKADLSVLGFSNFNGFLPEKIFSWDSLNSIGGFVILIGGGFLVGFGTRYANGCTSGHAIMGMSLLSIGSLVAVIGFFLGGLLMTHFLFPIIF